MNNNLFGCIAKWAAPFDCVHVYASPYRIAPGDDAKGAASRSTSWKSFETEHCQFTTFEDGKPCQKSRQCSVPIIRPRISNASSYKAKTSLYLDTHKQRGQNITYRGPPTWAHPDSNRNDPTGIGTWQIRCQGPGPFAPVYKMMAIPALFFLVRSRYLVTH
jgi:hypothetical protein